MPGSLFVVAGPALPRTSAQTNVEHCCPCGFGHAQNGRPRCGDVCFRTTRRTQRSPCPSHTGASSSCSAPRFDAAARVRVFVIVLVTVRDIPTAKSGMTRRNGQLQLHDVVDVATCNASATPTGTGNCTGDCCCCTCSTLGQPHRDAVTTRFKGRRRARCIDDQNVRSGALRLCWAACALQEACSGWRNFLRKNDR